MVVAYLALFVALGGSAYAVKQLPKNSVGPKQLKKNAVTTQKVRKNAIDGRRVKNNSLTGADINLNKLGTVPTAQTAGSASTANTANVANSLAPSENWHVVGAPGEPGFHSPWKNYGIGEPPAEPVAFYKDHEGIVHLRGIAFEGVGGSDIFYLPAGYRPAGGRYREFAVLCSCAGGVGPLFIYGSDDPVAEHTGGVYAPGSSVVLDGVGFRAES
jgi:hypothetical protein